MRTLVFCAVVAVSARQAWADSLPDIKSRSAVGWEYFTHVYDFGKDADEIRPIASTTKIFVAMAVRKRLDLDGWTEITRTDVEAAKGGSRTRLDIGQKFRNKDLLRAMLIASDNRAATAVGRAAGLSPDELVDAMNASGLAVIGTPDMAIAQVQRLVEQSGGFGAYLFMAHDWADREATLRSYELFANEVAPLFQGSTPSRLDSRDWAATNRPQFIGAATNAVMKAVQDHQVEKASKAEHPTSG